MRILADIPYVDAPSSDYPKGRIRNKNNAVVPAVIGTPAVEDWLGDIVQLCQHLVTLSGITENELPDNVTNGYQLFQALITSIRDNALATDALNGTIKKSTLSQALYSGSASTVMTSYQQQIKDGGICRALFYFTGWDMDSTDHIAVDLSALLPFDPAICQKVINISASVDRNDGSTTRPIGANNDGYCYFNNTSKEAYLYRTSGGTFDSAIYNNASGSIIIEYKSVINPIIP